MITFSGIERGIEKKTRVDKRYVDSCVVNIRASMVLVLVMKKLLQSQMHRRQYNKS